MRSARVLVGVVVVFAVTACGGSDDAADSEATTTAAATSSTVPEAETTTTPASATTTTAPAPTTTTAAVSDMTCGGVSALGGFLMDYANLNTPVEGIEFLVTDVILSADDAAWGRGRVSAPPDSGVEGFVGVAHCEDLGEGPAWTMRDAGTSGVGCMPEVPADLAFDC